MFEGRKFFAAKASLAQGLSVMAPRDWLERKLNATK